jgi:hypothetical protein
VTSQCAEVALSANTESIDETITTSRLSHTKTQIVGWPRRCQDQPPSSSSKNDDTEAPRQEQACVGRH